MKKSNRRRVRNAPSPSDGAPRSGVSRRHVLATGNAALVALAGAGGVTLPAQAQASAITTLAFRNTDAKPQPANVITRAFGHAFRKGDIPAGSFPRFELSDGTECPMSWWGRATYDDGSWRFAGFVLSIPREIPANGTIALSIKRTSTAPRASARSLADLAPFDFHISAVGRKNISGTWESRLNQGVKDGDDVQDLGDPKSGSGGGPVAKVFRIGQEFAQGGRDHDSLYAWFYVFVLQDSKGGLYGIRILPGYSMPWLQPGDARWKAFDSVVLKSANRPIAEVPLMDKEIEFTRAGEAFKTTGDQFSARAVLVTSNAGLPEGVVSGGVYGFAAGMIHKDGPGVLTSTYSWQQKVKASGAPGPHQGRVLPFIGRGNICFLCRRDAEYTFVNGSGGESSVIPLHDKIYLRRTALIPAIPAKGIGGPIDTALEYAWGHATGGGIHPHEPGTGGRFTIGPVHRLHAEHFVHQSPKDWKNCMILGLQAGWRQVYRFDRETRKIYKVRNGDYPEMSRISMVGHRWYSGAPLPSAVDPLWNNPVANDFALAGGHLVTIDNQHTNCLLPYSYLISGRPEMADMLAATPIDRIAALPVHHRDFIYKGKSYGGCIALDGSGRATAWGLRDIAAAVVLLPDEHHAKRHLADCWGDSVSMMVDAKKSAAPFFDRQGWPWHYNMVETQFWTPRPYGGMFANLYHFNMLVWIAQMFPESRTLEIVEQIGKMPAYFMSRNQLEMISAYTTLGYHSDKWEAPTDDAQVGEVFFAAGAKWSAEDSRIVMPGIDDGKKPESGKSLSRIAGLSNGDRIAFHTDIFRVAARGANIPGVQQHAPYVLRDVARDSFRLKALDGSPVRITESGTGTLIFTGVFKRGLNHVAYGDWPTAVQVESFCKSLRAMLGKSVISDEILAKIRVWMDAIGGDAARRSELQFVVEPE